MGIINSIANFFGKKETKIVSVSLDPDIIKRDHLVKALSYENAEIKSKLADYEQEFAKQKQREGDKHEEEHVKAVLNQQKQELQLQSQGKVLSLKSFYGRYFKDKKFREKLALYSFNRAEKLDDFGDFAIAEDGDFVVLNKAGDVILRMQNIKDIFQSVGALGNDLSAGKVPLWLDKEGGWIENIMEYELPEIISTGSKLRFAKARKRPVYEIIKGLNGEISQLHSDLVETESLAHDLQDKVDSYESQLSMYQQMSETSRAELTANDERLVGIDRVFRQTMRDITQLRKLHEIDEDDLTKLENEVDFLRGEAERNAVEGSDDRALKKIMKVRNTIKGDTIQNNDTEKKEISPQQPITTK